MVNLEYCRKDAKRLVRELRAGSADAVDRAQRVLGGRAGERLALSDALHVVAVERGFRSWPDLVAHAPRESVVDTGLVYRPGDAVRVRVLQRERRVSVSDGAGAAERAGLLPGWREVADRLERSLVVNVTRGGAVWLPVVPAGPGLDAIARRIAEASLVLYQELLELEG